MAKAQNSLSEGTPKHGPFSIPAAQGRRIFSAAAFIPDLFVSQTTVNQEYLTSSACLRPRRILRTSSRKVETC